MKFTSHEDTLKRVERLTKAAKIFTAIAGLTAEQAHLLITGLHDDHGLLTVTWNLEPSNAQRNAWVQAWTLVGEHTARIIHVVGGAL